MFIIILFGIKQLKKIMEEDILKYSWDTLYIRYDIISTFFLNSFILSFKKVLKHVLKYLKTLLESDN